MFRTLVFIFIVLVPLMGFSQKLEKRTVKLTYLRKPLRPLDRSTFQTYNCSLFRGFLEIPDERRLVERHLKLEGFRRVFSDGDLHIELIMKGLNLQAKARESDEDDGLRTNFRYRVQYSFPAVLVLRSRSGKQIDRVPIQEPGEPLEVVFGQSENFPTPSALERAWRQRRYEFLAEEEMRQVNRTFSEVRRLLSDRYSLQTATDKIKIAWGSGPYNYDDLEKAADLAQEGYLQLTLKNRDEGEKNLRAAIEIWLEAIREANLDKRRSRINKKITRWLHHNCANAYLWCREFEQARIHNRQASSLGLVLNPLSDEFINDLEARYLANRQTD